MGFLIKLLIVRNRDWLANRLPAGSQGNEVWLVKLACIDGPEEAEGFRNQRLLVRAADRPPLQDDDEFYVQVTRGMVQWCHTQQS